MSEEEKIALFDAYQANELSGQALIDFELLLDKNEDFKNDFEEYKGFAKKIKDGEEYGRIRKKLKSIHAETQKEKAPILRPKFYIPLIAAAVVALVVIILPNQFLGENGDTASADYQELSTAEEDNANHSDDYSEEYEPVDDNDSGAVIISKLDEQLSYQKGNPRGTCFLISNEGYFITAKHLVYKKKYVKIQQNELDQAFYTEVVYRDSLLDFAILKCSDVNAEQLKAPPYKLSNAAPGLGDDIFTLGYPKADIVFTKGSVSSANGFKSDSMTYEVSMPANKGNSGAPLFSNNGYLEGFVIANHSKKQSVTYVVKPSYIQNRIDNLQDSLAIDMRKNYLRKYTKLSDRVKKYTPFVYELY
ncbi:MAG: serine protease [Crocinitomicaceae bacterium]